MTASEVESDVKKMYCISIRMIVFTANGSAFDKEFTAALILRSTAVWNTVSCLSSRRGWDEKKKCFLPKAV